VKLVSSGKNKVQKTNNGRAGTQSGNIQAAGNIPQQNYSVTPVQNRQIQNPQMQNPQMQNRSTVPGIQNAPQNRGNPVNQQGMPYQNSNRNGNVKQHKIKPAPKKISPVKTIVIILMIIVIGVAALFISLGFYVDSLDTFFPNVWAEGIEVSGLTLPEATQKLLNDGYETNADGISVTISFPDESSFTFTGAEVGLSLNAQEAAAEAFKFGRTGTFIGNLQTYINSIFERTDLTDLSTPVFDDSVIREFAAEYTEMFNRTLIEGSLENDDSSITVIKGTGLQLADADAVYSLASRTLTSAVESHDHMTARYAPDRDDENNLDVQLREIERLFNEVHEDAVTPEYEFDADAEGYVTILSGSSAGRTFDLEDAKERIRNAGYGEPVVIHFTVLEPDYTENDVKDLIFRDVLYETSTAVGGSSNRKSNVFNAGRRIDGTIILPGETFSFNEVVGQRTREKGFLPAGAFIGGRVVDVIGGGICQTASTIYDALLHTHLEVIERHNHGMRVTYLLPGHDATVNWANPTKDLKFKNNTDFPVKIEVEAEGTQRIRVRLIGTNLDDSIIKIDLRNLVYIPKTSVTEETDDLYIDQTSFLLGETGARVEVWKLIFAAGADIENDEPLRETRISRDVYNMRPDRTLIGTREPPPPEIVPDGGGGGVTVHDPVVPDTPDVIDYPEN